LSDLGWTFISPLLTLVPLPFLHRVHRESGGLGIRHGGKPGHLRARGNDSFRYLRRSGRVGGSGSAVRLTGNASLAPALRGAGALQLGVVIGANFATAGSPSTTPALAHLILPRALRQPGLLPACRGSSSSSSSAPDRRTSSSTWCYLGRNPEEGGGGGAPAEPCRGATRPLSEAEGAAPFWRQGVDGPEGTRDRLRANGPRAVFETA